MNEKKNPAPSIPLPHTSGRVRYCGNKIHIRGWNRYEILGKEMDWRRLQRVSGSLKKWKAALFKSSLPKT